MSCINIGKRSGVMSNQTLKYLNGPTDDLNKRLCHIRSVRDENFKKILSLLPEKNEAGIVGLIQAYGNDCCCEGATLNEMQYQNFAKERKG